MIVNQSIRRWKIAGVITLTLHGGNVGALDVVLELSDALLELIEGDELVLDDEGDLELLDTVADSHERTRTPDKTGLLDRANGLLELNHVGFIVPRLNVKRHNGLVKEISFISIQDSQ